MSALFSLIAPVALKMKSVSETSGMLTSGYGPRNIILGVRRLDGTLA
jgi:hypothetical protein